MNASSTLAHTDYPKEWLCIRCNTLIAQKRRRHNARFCTKQCSYLYRTGQFKGINERLTGLSPSTVGALSELIVSVDLLKRGYEVFRALSPSCSCDLAIIRSAQLYRVEVRTGYKTITGGIQASRKDVDAGRFDIFAIVVGQDIVYEPDLMQLFP